MTSLALLACVEVNEEGFREVLAVEVAGSEKRAAYASLLRDLLDRGLKGVRLVISDDHKGIKAAVAGELPGAEWQRCAVHFQRNVLSHVLTILDGRGSRGPFCDLQGQERKDRAGPSRGVRRAVWEELPQGGLGL